MIINSKYNTLLNLLGEKINTSTVAKLAKIPRTTVEYELNKLAKANLVTKTKDKNQTYWEKIVKESPVSKAVTIHGNKNIAKEIERTIHHKKMEVLVIESDKTVNIFERKLMSGVFNDLNKKLSQKSSLVYILFHKSTVTRMKEMLKNKTLSLESLELLSNRAMSAHVLPESFLNLNVHIATVGDTVFITDFKKEISIKLKETDLAKFFKQLYELVSPFLEKVNMQTLIEDIKKI